MKSKQALIVIGQANPNAWNQELIQTVQKTFEKGGIQTLFSDLYALKFNPVLSAEDFEAFAKRETPSDILQEQQKVAQAKYIVFVYPVWWYDRPAILKGWIDRVFSYGFAYEVQNQVSHGLLKNKAALVIQTTGETQKTLEDRNAIAMITGPMAVGTLDFCGFSPVLTETLYAVTRKTEFEKKQMLLQVEARVQELIQYSKPT